MTHADTLRRALIALAATLSLVVAGCGETPVTGATPPSIPDDASTEEPADAADMSADAAEASDAATQTPDASCGGGACTTGNPCETGTLTCTGDGGMVCVGTPAADGTSCGTDQVCLAGACTACVAGGACTDPMNPCKKGTFSCATGKQVCANLTDAADGTACGTNQVCNKGACEACAAGAVCQDPADPCKQGTLDCSAGPVCKNTTAAPNGTACGANKACLNGTCQCQPGGACSNSANACQTGSVTCDGSGNPVCGNFKNLPDGTSCGANQACLAGACQCQPGGSCVDPTNPCRTGTITCDASGKAVCGNFGNAANGTSCGTDQVCNNGACTACASGGACLFGVCKLGTYSCSTGTKTCANPTNAANGTVCGTNQVCNNGTCTACTAGGTCNQGGNQCRVGTITCATGQQTCGNVQNAPDGTACGAGRVCIAGSCQTCNNGATCSPPGNVCQTGTLSCGAGGPSCGNLMNVADNTPCGQNQVCQSGKCVCSNPCSNAGATACTSGGQLQTCQKDANGCFFLQNAPCPANQTCNATSGKCECMNTCTTAGQSTCASATTIQTCTADANGCLSLQPRPAATCPSQNGTPGVCANGACTCAPPTAGTLYVSRNTGNDQFGNGSQGCPFRSITKAVSVAAASGATTTISVAAVNAGNNEFYDASIGEKFPITIPANVTVQGGNSLANAANYWIVGTGAPDAQGLTTTLFMNGGKLSGFTLRSGTGFGGIANSVLIACSAGSPTVENSSLRRAHNALRASGTCGITFNGNQIDSNNAAGPANAAIAAQLAIGDNANVTLKNNTINGANGVAGVAAGGSATLSMLTNTLNGMTAGVLIGNSANVTLSGNAITVCTDGVRCAGTAKLAMTANNVSFNTNGVRIGDGCTANLSGGPKDMTTGCGSQANTFKCNNFRNGPDVTANKNVNADGNLWDHATPTTADIATTNGGVVSTMDSCLAANACQ